jgi:hypothetical protein
MSEGVVVFGVIFGGAVLFVLVLVVTIIGLSRHFNRVNCDAFARNTSRPTKFVIYNFASSGECLTPSGKGTWIPTSGLREFGAKP